MRYDFLHELLDWCFAPRRFAWAGVLFGGTLLLKPIGSAFDQPFADEVPWFIVIGAAAAPGGLDVAVLDLSIGHLQVAAAHCRQAGPRFGVVRFELQHRLELLDRYVTGWCREPILGERGSRPGHQPLDAKLAARSEAEGAFGFATGFTFTVERP